MPFLRAYRQDSEPDAETMTFVASTPGVKRDGLEIDQSKWNLAPYETNPVVLWAHDYSSLPIGRASVRVEDGRLMTDVTFDTADEFAAKVRDKYARGFLNAVSVGWRDVETGEGKAAEVQHELLDISAVPVPGDPDALAERQRSALRELGWRLMEIGNDEELDQAALDEIMGAPLDRNTPAGAEDAWPEVAAAMVAVFAPRSDDAQRQREYNALLPKYRRLGKIPPEWLDSDDLADLDADNWRGLFLEGELGHAGWLYDLPERAGAVLNARNKADLRKASDLILGVLRSAEKGEPDEDEERAADPTVTVSASHIWLTQALEALGNE